MKISALILSGLFVVAQSGLAQQRSLVNELTEHWQASKTLSMAVTDAMPADQFNFKATPPEMTFGQQMDHLAADLMQVCSSAAGTKAPMAKPADDSKKTALRYVDVAYDYCIDGLKSMGDAKLLTPVNVSGKNYTPFALYWNAFTHAAHHRGQAEVYLRLKGITPPNYMF